MSLSPAWTAPPAVVLALIVVATVVFLAGALRDFDEPAGHADDDIDVALDGPPTLGGGR